VIVYHIKDVQDNVYFRLRGTNNKIGVNTVDIDENGDPLNDYANPAVGNDEAWNDLWFYSNPIFVRVK
jgi:hypothetical protein